MSGEKKKEKKTYYCPFDLEPIDMNNLAYELAFNENFTYLEAQNDKNFIALTTVDGDSVIELSAERRKEIFGYEDDKEDPCLIVLENDDSEGGSAESGLSFFIENVELNGKAGHEDTAAENKSAENYGLQMPDKQFLDRDGNTGVKMIGSNKRRGFRKPSNLEKYNLVKVKVNNEGNYEFFNKARQKVMTALPCCPHCHMRLPKGWGDVEDFCIVSLIGPTGSGKTTMLLSLMADQWKALGKRIRVNGSTINITPANYSGYGGFYDDMSRLADQLSKDGECPEGTVKEKLIQPVFLNINYKKHRMAVGIYDNAGENLANPDTIRKGFLKAVIDRSNVDMYLFDPEDMNIELVRSRIDSKSIKEVLENCKVEDIEEQGKNQAAAGKKRILAKEVLRAAYKGEEKTQNDQQGRNKTTLDVYRSVKLARNDRTNEWEKRKNRRFLGVIIKSDLLSPVVDENTYGTLFRNTSVDPSMKNIVDLTSDTITDMIKEYRLLGNLSDAEVDEIGEEYKGLSWHCISALGCDAELHGALKGAYDPIRVEEPLIRCIVDRIADNGWINEESGRGENK